MVLDEEMRGILEKVIDHTISKIPKIVDMARTVSAIRELQIKNPDDFVLGLAWGDIIRAFSERFALKRSGVPSEEETGEISNIVMKRTKEIKEAIFKCG